MTLSARFFQLLCCAVPASVAAEVAIPQLDQAQLQWLGDQIFSNECNRQTACLTTWNQGEDFPSLGIGHFIWYRAGQEGIFEETFPGMLAFLAASGVKVPDWVTASRVEQPWPDRAAFLAAAEGAQLTALRSMLDETRAEQTAYIVDRFARSVPQLLAGLPLEERSRIEARLNAIAASNRPLGVYALIDYVHFKGTGLSPDERYRDEGWGLLQVLQQMQDDASSPLAAFVASAASVLQRRVDNAPVDRQEQRWLAGWQNRLNTYLPKPD
jgi:hypothetical protein